MMHIAHNCKGTTFQRSFEIFLKFSKKFNQIVFNHFCPNCFLTIFTKLLFTAASSCKTKFYLYLVCLTRISIPRNSHPLKDAAALKRPWKLPMYNRKFHLLTIITIPLVIAKASILTKIKKWNSNSSIQTWLKYRPLAQFSKVYALCSCSSDWKQTFSRLDFEQVKGPELEV